MAFFSTLSLLPTLVALVSIYGLLAPPEMIQGQLEGLASVLPGEASRVVREQTVRALSSASDDLGWQAALALLLALFSASGGAKRLLDALNIAYDEQQRGFLRQRFLAVVLAAGGIVVGVVSLALIALMPPLLEALLPTGRNWLLVGRWALMGLGFFIGLCVLYRIAPDRRAARWPWLGYGAALATIIWMAASKALAFYFEHIAEMSSTYGPLGGVFALMIWIYVSVFVILLGAELNSELEAQTARDSTVGPSRPMGRRGAMKADTLGEPRPGDARISIVDFLEKGWSTRRRRERRKERDSTEI